MVVEVDEQACELRFAMFDLEVNSEIRFPVTGELTERAVAG